MLDSWLVCDSSQSMPAFTTSVMGWRITRQGEFNKGPGGWIYWKDKCQRVWVKWTGARCSASISTLCFQVLGVCAGAGQSHTAFRKRGRGAVIEESGEESGHSGDMSHQCVWRGGFCSRPLMIFSSGRPPCAEYTQVFLLGLQGNADECSGHVSQPVIIIMLLSVADFTFLQYFFHPLLHLKTCTWNQTGLFFIH